MRALGPYVMATLMLSRSVMLFAAQAESPKTEVQLQKDTTEKPSLCRPPPKKIVRPPRKFS